MAILKTSNIHFDSTGTTKIEWRNTTDNVVRIEAGAIKIPVGDTTSRPSGTPGLIRYNTTLGQLEGYNVSSWGPLASIVPIPAGTITLFPQTAAPTGWTKNTSANNNHMIRVVTGSAANGGSIDFTTVFTTKTPVGSIGLSGSYGNVTLAENEIPSHSHTYTVSTPLSTTLRIASPGYFSNFQQAYLWPEGGGGTHSHPIGTTAASFTGTSIDLSVRYLDVIVATKD